LSVSVYVTWGQDGSYDYKSALLVGATRRIFGDEWAFRAVEYRHDASSKYLNPGSFRLVAASIEDSVPPSNKMDTENNPYTQFRDPATGRLCISQPLPLLAEASFWCAFEVIS